MKGADPPKGFYSHLLASSALLSRKIFERYRKIMKDQESNRKYNNVKVR